MIRPGARRYLLRQWQAIPPLARDGDSLPILRRDCREGVLNYLALLHSSISDIVPK